MYEVEAVCDRVLFLSRGKILLEGDPKTLPREHGAASLDDLFVQVAHESVHEGPAMPTERGDYMTGLRVAAHRIAPALSDARQPAAGAADLRLGGGRHPAMGLHHPLSQHRRPLRLSTSCRLCWAPCCCGIS